MKEENKNETIPEIKNEAVKPKSDMFWKIAVLGMFLMVGAQTFIIYSMLEKRNAGFAGTGSDQTDAVVLAPRSTQPRAAVQQPSPTPAPSAPACQTQTCPQNLPIPPLPKLNVTVDKQGKPVIPSYPQQQQERQFAQVPQSPFNSFPQGFSINIGPGMMGMDIRREMERMERIMDSFFRMGGISRLHSSIPRPDAFNRAAGLAVSSPSIREEGDKYVVTLKIPGMDKSDVKAEVKGGMLTISGTKRMETDNQSGNGHSYVSSYSSFQNSFSLPGPVKADKMTMEYKNDTLVIKLPKA